MTNPLLRGPVDLLRPSVHGLASSLRLVAPRSCQRISRPCNDLQCRDSGLVQRDVMECLTGMRTLLRCDVRSLSDLRPFLDFRTYDELQFLRAGAFRIDTKLLGLCGEFC